MKNISPLLKRGGCALFSCFLIFNGCNGVQAAVTSNPTAKVEAAALKSKEVTSNEAFVYYVSNGVLYRVMSDGTKCQKIVNSFQGVQLTPAGKYLYYMYDEKTTTLLRTPVDGSALLPSRFQSDVLHFVVEGEYIYYMNDKGAIYRTPVNAKSNSPETKLVTDMADVNCPGFEVINGQIYYNALKSGRATWVASKAADGTGKVQWITKGAVESPWFIRSDDKSVYMIINTKPEETQYSLDCMVLYSISKKDGTSKALNKKTPINANAVYAGDWSKGYYMYNNGIMLDEYNEFDYLNAEGSIIDMKGNMIKLHNMGIREVANFDSNKLAFVDGKGNAYISTIKNNKVTDKKELPIENVGYVRNIMTKDGVKGTMIFAQSGAYMIQSDLSLKEVVGIEWDLCTYKDDIPGIFYINAGDNGRLYRGDADSKKNIKLSDEKVSRIVLISKP